MIRNQHSVDHANRSPPNDSIALSAEERTVMDAIRSTPFGAVEVIVHQSRIVQIVKTEKIRIDATAIPNQVTIRP
jgi:hypothetical protein